MLKNSGNLNINSEPMRSILIVFLMSIFFLQESGGQEKNHGLDISFSLIHPSKWSMNEYSYSVDPTLEVLYSVSLFKGTRIAGGIFVQTGKHNWLEPYGHTFYDDFGMPYRLRTDFNRRLEFFSLGIPVKLELETNNFIFNSFILGFTPGNHLKLEKADYYDNELVTNFHVYDDYNSLFWELNFGFSKILCHNEIFALSLQPMAGFRNESSKMYFAYYDYIFYGLGIRIRWNN